MSLPTLTGGYEFTFADAVHERYVCKICLHPCHDAYLSGCCGHNFCKSCLDRFRLTASLAQQRRNAAVTCPFCRNVEFTTLPNKQADREIRSFHVMCSNMAKGCEWQGELNDITNHLGNSDGCQFEDVKCSNECGKMLQRRYLTSHVETECPHRKVDCQFCHIAGEHQFIEGEHKEQCPKVPLSCPNECEAGDIIREDMEAHRKECPLEMIQCEYHNVGCEERMMRKRKRNHEEEKMEEHLLMTKLKLSKSEVKVAINEAKLCSTDARLSEAEQKLAANEAKLISTESKLSETESILAANEVELFSTKRKLNNLEVIVHRLINTTGSSNSLIGSAQWSSHLSTMALKVSNVIQVCPVVVRMSNVARHKAIGVGLNSEPFYTVNSGYKMYLRAYPDGKGVGKGTHLSVFLFLTEGPHDDELAWPLIGKFAVTLLNQVNNSDHCSVIVTYDNLKSVGRVTGQSRGGSGFGYQKLISHEEYYRVTPRLQYLKEDCIFFKIDKLQ